MKNALVIWKWSLLTALRSQLALLALAAVMAVWGFGAYRWLWFPAEGSGLTLIVGLIWALAQWALLAAFLASAVTSANSTVSAGATSIALRTLGSFNVRQWLRCVVFVLLAALVVLAIREAFSRANNYSLEVASFLTFRSEHPVHPVTVEKVFWVIEMLLWIAVGGFLLGFLNALVRHGWRASAKSVARLLANACWRSTFVTTLVSWIVFGSLAYLLATWHPKVSPGFADYAQALLRLGVALVLGVVGWLFWVLSLARLNLPGDESPAP